MRNLQNNPIVKILMERDEISRVEACELVSDAIDRVVEGEDPEEILYDEFGLEPDFVLDLILSVV